MPSITQSLKNTPQIAKAAPKSSPFALAAVAFGAAVAGVTFVSMEEAQDMPGIEHQFGTADGYFPSATPGASLAKPPGNKNFIAGQHYVSNYERRSYPTKRKSTLRKTTQRD